MRTLIFCGSPRGVPSRSDTRWPLRRAAWLRLAERPLWATTLLCACEQSPALDLQGPRIVAVSPAAELSLRAPVRFEALVTFDEALDRESVHPGAVTLLAWERGEPCRWNRDCDDAVCVAGRCQSDPVTSGDLNALLDGDFDDADAIPLTLSWSAEPAGDARELIVRSGVTLSPWTKHSLLLGAVRDRAGSPLVDEAGLAIVYRHDFTTGAPGSGGPEATLSIPSVGTDGVPPNLSMLELRFERPIAWPWPAGATIELVDEQGQVQQLRDAEPCPRAVPGTCVRVRADLALSPKTRYRLGASSLVDRWGRVGVAGHIDSTFRTALLPDLVAPMPASTDVLGVGGCVVTSTFVDEPVELVLDAGGASSLGHGAGAVALAVRPTQSQSDSWNYQLALEDLAGNRATITGVVERDEFATAEASLVIVEVLADAIGPEGEGEFVELFALADGSADDLRLADLSWEAVRAAYLAGDLDVGDPLGPLSWDAGDLVVVAGADFAAKGVPTNASIIRVDGPLGSGGLKNSGEPVTLFGTAPLRRISVFEPISGTASGRSAVRQDPRACDVTSAWRPHPLGAASPGALP